MKLSDLYDAAGLTEEDRSRMPSYIEGEDEFYGSEAFGKLYDYFCDTGEMPYGIAKSRTGDPVLWILERIEVIYESK
tara:strand:+ start:321 stop:551 length:231 start_codon:yes stop_codon:yes gene_type:complete